MWIKNPVRIFPWGRLHTLTNVAEFNNIRAMTVDRIPISKFSIITRISPKALRYYDQKALLVPAAKDLLTGYRYYTADQLEKGVRIKTLCNLGLGLEEISSFLEKDAKGDHEAIEAQLREHLCRVQGEISRLQKIAALLEQKDKDVMKMALIEPVIKDVPTMRVLSKRDKGSYAETIHRLIEDLKAVVQQPNYLKNLMRVTGPYMTIFHDQEYKENYADIEAVVPITGRIEVDDPGIEVKNLPGVKVLAVLHNGSYENLHLTYKEILEHMTKSGLEFSGSMRELYLSNPHKTPADELMVEIQVPIK